MKTELPEQLCWVMAVLKPFSHSSFCSLASTQPGLGSAMRLGNDKIGNDQIGNDQIGNNKVGNVEFNL